MTDARTPEFCDEPVLVLGCGNPLMGDDGFGPAVVERLSGRLPDGVRLVDAGSRAGAILYTITLSEVRPKRIILVDAVDAGREPGEVFEVAPEELSAIQLDPVSTHFGPAGYLLMRLRDQCGIAVTILGCQMPRPPDSVAPGLSEPVRAAVAKAAEMILEGVAG